MKKSPQIKAKIVPEGVNIYDLDGSWLAGITERQAIELHASLGRLIPRLIQIIDKYKLTDE